MSTRISDQDQRNLATDPYQSFSIRAPAGSGKTELLIQRVIRLLEIVDHPKRILVITFTREAAKALKERLVKRLFIEQPEHYVHKRASQLQWDWSASDIKCHIMTIDAWVQSWLKHPYKIHPLPEWLYREAWGHWLSFNRHETSLQYVLEYFDNRMDKLSEWFIDALSKRAMWIWDAYEHANWSDIILLRQQQLLQTIKKELDDILPYKNELFDIIKKQQSTNPWQSIAALLLTKDGTARKNFTKAQNIDINQKQLKERLKEIAQSLSLRCITLLQYMQSDDTEQDKVLLDHLQLLLKDVAASLYLVFERYSACDFTQHLLDALDMIEKKTEVMELEHLLLDEAQDTSQLQLQLLIKLTKKWQNPHQSIFIVGDPMQSIYRFRDADVREFMRILEKGFSHHHLRTITLSTNFRQAENLVSLINEIFHEIMPQSSHLEEGAIPFTKSLAATTTQGKYQAILWQDDYDKEYEYNLLKKMQTQHIEKSIGILVRSRKQAQHLIDNSSNAIELLDASSSAILCDAIAMLKLCLDPTDSMNFMHIARSKWLGLSLEEIARLDPRSLLLQLDNIEKIENNNLRYGLASYISSKQDSYASHWLSWMQKLSILQEFKEDELSIIIKIYVHLNDWQAAFGTFTHEYIDCLFSKQRLTSLNSDTTIMSIHKSKGLEFDYVYLPQFDASCKNTTINNLVLTTTFTDNGSVFNLWQKSKTHNNIFMKIQKQQEHYENIRLLYVALTRAKHGLILSAKKIRNQCIYLPKWETQIGEAIEKKIIEKIKTRIIQPNITKTTNTTVLTGNTSLGTLMHIGLYRAWLKTPKTYLNMIENADEKIWLERFCLLQGIEKYVLDRAVSWLEDLLREDIILHVLKKRNDFCEAEYSIDKCRLDRVYLENNIIHIIDYKISGESNSYTAQLSIYAKLLKKQFPNYIIKTYILWLNTLTLDDIKQ